LLFGQPRHSADWFAVPRHPDLSPLLHLAWLLAVLVAAAPAQTRLQDYRSSSATQMMPGLKAGVLSFNTMQGTTETSFAEALPGTDTLTAEVVLPLGGPSTSARLVDLALSVKARTIIGVELQPAAEEPGGLPGVRMNRDRLSSWPPKDLIHLVTQTEGNSEFRTLEPGTGLVSIDGGTTLTLLSLNGDLPTSGGLAAVYTGALSGTEPPAALWPADLTCFLLAPDEPDADPHALFLPQESRNRRFIPLRLLAREELVVDKGRAVLILAPPVDLALLRALLGQRPVTVTINLPARERIADVIMPLGQRLVRDGELTPGLEPTELVENALCLDASRRKLLLLSPARKRGRGVGLPLEKLQAYLRDTGYTDAVRLPARGPLLIPDCENADDDRETAATQVRLALAFTAKATTLTLPDVAGEFFRIRGAVVQGTRREFPGNMTRALRDEQIVSGPDLGQFWAAPMMPPGAFSMERVEDNPNAIWIVLPKPTRVGVMELIHAESAGLSPSLNLKAFRLLGREKTNTEWRVLAEVRHEEPTARDRLVLAGAPLLLEMRLEVLEPNFLAGGNVARLSELLLWGTEPGL
jgi:hypothetical protein